MAPPLATRPFLFGFRALAVPGRRLQDPAARGRLLKVGLAAGLGFSLSLSGTAIAQRSSAQDASPRSKPVPAVNNPAAKVPATRNPSGKNPAAGKETDAQPRVETPPSAGRIVPLDQGTMTAPGSLLTLNGSTFPVGLTSTLSSLKKVGSGLPPGVSVSGDAVVVERSGTVIDGYDFRGYTVSAEADNVTIRNNLFNAAGYHTVYQGPNASGIVVEFNTFDGEKANHPTNGDMVLSENEATIRNNEFLNLPADAANVAGGVVERNYFSGASYQKDAHADAISVHRTIVPVLIRENYIDYIDRPDAAQGTNAAVKIVSHFGKIDQVTVDSNVLLGGGYTIYVSPAQDPNTGESHPIANVTITNNDIGFAKYGAVAGGNHGTNYNFTNNHDFGRDAHLLAAGAASPVAGSPSQEPLPTIR